MDRTCFYVVDENKLCYDMPRAKFSLPRLFILSASILRGAITEQNGESVYVSKDDKRVRRATREDFDTFRVNWEQYASRPNEYDMGLTRK